MENHGIYLEIVNPSEEMRACELEAGYITARESAYETYYSVCPYEETFVLEGHSSKTFILYECTWNLHNKKIKLYVNGVVCQFYL